MAMRNTLTLKPMNLPVTLDELFSVKEHNFNELALKIFRYQARENTVYRSFLNHLSVDADAVQTIEEIPFLPIEFFKSHQVISGSWTAKDALSFRSSSTTGKGQSFHYYRNLELYDVSIKRGFEFAFGESADWEILTLLPGYHLNPFASLSYMVKVLGVRPEDAYIDDLPGLADRLLSTTAKKRMLIGVTHALVDFAQSFDVHCPDLTILETGGMKGRRRELTRSELHEQLQEAFGVKQIGSEYGMTELFSQAYSTGHGRYQTPPWMQVFIRELEDPFSPEDNGRSGGINVIDLANLDSCAFIATSDIGRCHSVDTFEVLGRTDHSDVRGCNVLIV